MAKLTKVYWDSCAWIGLINGEPDKKRELEIIFSQAARGYYQLWCSANALVEVNRYSDEEGLPKPLDAVKSKVLDDLFKQPFVKIIPCDLAVGLEARRIVRETPKFRNKFDAVHIASATRFNIELMHTYDRPDLLDLNGLFFCKNGNPLVICYPDETTDGSLFSKKRQSNG